MYFSVVYLYCTFITPYNRCTYMADLGGFIRPQAAIPTKKHPMIRSRGGQLGDKGAFHPM